MNPNQLNVAKAVVTRHELLDEARRSRRARTGRRGRSGMLGLLRRR